MNEHIETLKRLHDSFSSLHKKTLATSDKWLSIANEKGWVKDEEDVLKALDAAMQALEIIQFATEIRLFFQNPKSSEERGTSAVMHVNRYRAEEINYHVDCELPGSAKTIFEAWDVILDQTKDVR